MALLVLRTREERRVSGAAQSAFREPRWGVPTKAMAKVEERSDFTCNWEVPREIRRACSTTRPPRLWATKITGRLLYCQLVKKAVLDLVFAYCVCFCSSQGEILSERFAVVAYGVSARDIEEFDHVCVVSEGKDSHVFEIIRKKIFWPEDRFLVRPCGFTIPGEAVDEYNTEVDVRCALVVRLGAYSTVSVAPSATVLSPYAPAVENSSSAGSSACLSFSDPFFFLPLVFKWRNIPTSGIPTAIEPMCDSFRRMCQGDRHRAAICLVSAAAAGELTKPAGRCAIGSQPYPTM